MGRIRDVAVAVLATTLAAAGPLAAQTGGYFRSDNFAYLGQTTCYLTLTDALTHTASNCGVSEFQRDLGLSFNNDQLFGSPEAAFITNNYSAPVKNNPSNTPVGYVQMYDADASTASSMSMTWDNSLTEFTLAAAGGNTVLGCQVGGDCGQLGVNGQRDGGMFVSWNINATFTGFVEATFNDATGLFESASDPLDVNGTLNGVFWDAVTNRYYDFDATLSADSWSVGQGYSTNTIAGGVAPITATPEPGSIALMATGLIGLGGYSIRRRRNQRAA